MAGQLLGSAAVQLINQLINQSKLDLENTEAVVKCRYSKRVSIYEATNEQSIPTLFTPYLENGL